MNNKDNEIKSLLEFQEAYTNTYEKYKEFNNSRNKLNDLYKKLMNQDEMFLDMSNKEKDECINDFINKPFEEILKYHTIH